ncbi:MAG: hypothetical protein ACTSRP_11335 [Candidatus Helarchaeota archaeon]
MSLVFVRLSLFYIYSHQKCEYCEAFLNSKTYLELRNFNRVVDGVRFIYREMPSDWSDQHEIYSDEDLEKILNNAEESERLELAKLCKNWSADKYIRNFLKAIAYDIDHFPAMILELFYSDNSMKTIKIEGFIEKSGEGELQINLLDLINAYLRDDIHVDFIKEAENRLKHEKAFLPGSAHLRARLKEEEEKSM